MSFRNSGKAAEVSTIVVSALDRTLSLSLSLSLFMRELQHQEEASSMMLPFIGYGIAGYLTFQECKDTRVEQSRVDDVDLFGGSTGEEGATSIAGGQDLPLIGTRNRLGADFTTTTTTANDRRGPDRDYSNSSYMQHACRNNDAATPNHVACARTVTRISFFLGAYSELASKDHQTFPGRRDRRQATAKPCTAGCIHSIPLISMKSPKRAVSVVHPSRLASSSKISRTQPGRFSVADPVGYAVT
jgi:hypothetical protein